MKSHLLAAGCVCLAALAAGCRTSLATRQLDAALPPVEATVDELRLHFGSPGEGELSFVVDLPGASSTGARAVQVSWQLWLAGRPFASGIGLLDQPVAPVGPARIEVHQPFRFSARGVRGGEHVLEVKLSGSVLVASPAADRTMHFNGGLRLVVESPPLLEAPES